MEYTLNLGNQFLIGIFLEKSPLLHLTQINVKTSMPVSKIATELFESACNSNVLYSGLFSKRKREAACSYSILLYFLYAIKV